MNIDEYMSAVIDLFKSGRATEQQWKSLGECVLAQSESEGGKSDAIDDEVLGPQSECSGCGTMFRANEGCRCGLAQTALDEVDDYTVDTVGDD